MPATPPSISLSPDFLLPFLMQQLTESQKQQATQEGAANQTLLGAQRETTGLGNQLSSLMALPPERVNPWAELAANIGGGLSQIAAPQLGGQDRAQQLVQGEQQSLNQRRGARLKMLETAYERAAERASKLGDDAQHIKMLQAAERVSNNLKALNDAAIVSSSDKTRARISAGENATSLKVADIRAAADRYAADQRRDEASARLATTKLAGFTPDKDWQATKRGILTAKVDTPDARDKLVAQAHDLILTVPQSMGNNPTAFARQARTTFIPLGKEGWFGRPSAREAKNRTPLATPDEVLSTMISDYQLTPDEASGFMEKAGYSRQEIKAARAVYGR